MDRNHLDPKAVPNTKKEANKAQNDQRNQQKYGYALKRPVSSEGLNPADRRGVRKLILCFDGTGNKFHGDDSDSNILKIFRMLDRTADDQYHYYQPGIGTYVVSRSLTHTSVRDRISSWYSKAKDSAVGSSFDQHVVGGYRFLMRFYNPGDEIYFFGFSRGAYIARFLAEMLDFVGLLSHGNEEMVRFAWKAFAQWQARQSPSGSEEEKAEAEHKRHEMFKYMKGFRETFSRPVGRIRFLGLFDTVNSVPRFETAWMQRSKFPYTARSSARVIRHAVSIDERRAKFRQDLMYQDNHRHKHHHHHHPIQDMFEGVQSDNASKDETNGDEEKQTEPRGRKGSKFLSPDGASQGASGESERYEPYRPSSASRQRAASRQRGDPETASSISVLPASEIDPDWDEDGQDIDEVWFSGGHGDVGGGWEALKGRKSASHVPLAWIVREAIKAGLPFDLEKVAELGCSAQESIRQATAETLGENGQTTATHVPDIKVGNGSEARIPSSPSSPEMNQKEFRASAPEDGFAGMMEKAHTSRIHDSLTYSSGLVFSSVTAWKFMEWLPFRRMDLRPDGTWAPIRWPLPRGEVRDIPDNVRVHGSVLRRMKMDKEYRPGNLIIGGGGRGVRMAPEEYGIGEWICVAEPGDIVGEIWTRKPKEEVPES